MGRGAQVSPARRSAGAASDEVDERLKSLDDLAWLLDARWRIPGTSIRFGADAVAGLLPGVGDAAAGLVSLYIIHRASQHGAPTHLLVRMVGNVLVDTTIGSVPLLGSVFDVFFKANKRNVRLLRRHLERNPLPRGTASTDGKAGAKA